MSDAIINELIRENKELQTKIHDLNIKIGTIDAENARLTGANRNLQREILNPRANMPSESIEWNATLQAELESLRVKSVSMPFTLAVVCLFIYLKSMMIQRSFYEREKTMAIFQKEYDHLTAENTLLRSSAKPSIVPQGDVYTSIKELLEFINDGATDKARSVTDIANAITISIFGQRGLSLSNNKSTPLVTAANMIMSKIESGKANNNNVPKGTGKPRDPQDSKRQKNK